MRNVLITGGAGFIGLSLTKKLVEAGYAIISVDSLSEQVHGSQPSAEMIFGPNFDDIEFIEGDVRDRSLMESLINRIDTVIHLAAETGTGQSMYDIYKYSDVNIGGTSLLLDVLANTVNHVNKVIVASSRAIYGEGKYHCEIHGAQYPDSRRIDRLENLKFEHSCSFCDLELVPLPTDEDSKLSPASIYGVTKCSQEQLTLAFCQSREISGFGLRFQNVYGPGQSLNNPYTGILSIFSSRILQGLSINIFEDGLESRDFVFIDDVVQSIIKSIEVDNPFVGPLNIGSGIPTDVLSVTNFLQEKIGRTCDVEITGQFRIGDIRHNFAALDKAKTVLQYEPKVSFEDGIGRYVSWVQEQKISTDNYELSLTELRNRKLLR
jgi:dTDP-L-rhamnose 4-epimerase